MATICDECKNCVHRDGPRECFGDVHPCSDYIAIIKEPENHSMGGWRNEGINNQSIQFSWPKGLS